MWIAILHVQLASCVCELHVLSQVGVNTSVNTIDLLCSCVPHNSHTSPGCVYDDGLMR